MSTDIRQIENLLGVPTAISRMDFGAFKYGRIFVTAYDDDTYTCNCRRKMPCTHIGMAKSPSNSDCWELFE